MGRTSDESASLRVVPLFETLEVRWGLVCVCAGREITDGEGQQRCTAVGESEGQRGDGTARQRAGTSSIPLAQEALQLQVGMCEKVQDVSNWRLRLIALLPAHVTLPAIPSTSVLPVVGFPAS